MCGMPGADSVVMATSVLLLADMLEMHRQSTARVGLSVAFLLTFTPGRVNACKLSFVLGHLPPLAATSCTFSQPRYLFPSCPSYCLDRAPHVHVHDA
jgi:TctA family transporter